VGNREPAGVCPGKNRGKEQGKRSFHDHGDTDLVGDDSPERVYRDYRRRGLKSEGCQYKIADQIVKAGADYVLSLKENQETLYDDVKTYFKGIDFAHPDPLVQTDRTFEVDHGRRERRNHAVTGDVSWLVDTHPAWNTIKSIGVVESIRTIGERVTTELRYYELIRE
jgi:predicted transposase YbfD/YdcC